MNYINGEAMETRKISIITPSYQQGKYIERAIKSVLNQNYSNLEHIIIDGGSDDGTLDILKRYPHLRWISEKDEGQSDALNKGFQMASGEIIGWLNCDDYYEKDIFGRVMQAFEDPETDAVYGQNYFIDVNGNIVGRKYPNEPNRLVACFYCYIPTTSFFFRRNLLSDRDFIDKNFDITMDKELFARLFSEQCRMRYLREPLAYFMWHEDNKSAKSPRVKKICQKESIEIMNRYFFNFRRLPDRIQFLLQRLFYYIAILRRKTIM